jgi:hypothetical protein
MQPSNAETLALKGLAFLAADGDALLRFLTQSGLELEDLRAQAGNADLLAAVLDILLGDDALLTEFTNGEHIAPQFVHAARRVLPGAAPEF